MNAIRRIGAALLESAAIILAVVVFVLPLVALIARPILDGHAPQDGWSIGAVRWRLLGESAAMAAGAAALSLLLAWPGAWVWGTRQRGRLSLVITAGLMLPVLVSPMVAAFGWQQALSMRGVATGAAPWLCMAGWAAWTWPAPALILGSAWRRSAREPFEAALLTCSPAAAFVRVALPILAPHVAAAALLVFVILIGEYVVPHAWGLRVYATELLSWSIETAHTIDAVWPALPLVGGIALLMAAAWATARRIDVRQLDAPRDEPHSRAGWGKIACLAVATLTLGLPLAALIVKLATVAALAEAWQVHGGDLLRSLAVAAAAAAATLIMATGLLHRRRVWVVVLGASLAFGVLPGALVGEGVLAAFGVMDDILPPTALGRWYDSPLMVVAGLAARYGWIALLILHAAVVRRRGELDDQAALDGATAGQIVRRVHLPANVPALVAAGLLVAAFALADVAVATQVQVSSIRLAALLLVEAMHRFEDGLLVAISLWLLAAALPGAIVAAWAMRRE